MSKLRMKKIELIAMLTDSKKIIELLQRRGVVDTKDIDLKKEGVTRLNTSAQENTFSKAIALFENALSKRYREKVRVFQKIKRRQATGKG